MVGGNGLRRLRGLQRFAFAEALARRRNMTVITNSPQIARILAKAEMRHLGYGAFCTELECFPAERIES
jgi:hypothetical protein